jgi:hypothetical protein
MQSPIVTTLLSCLENIIDRLRIQGEAMLAEASSRCDDGNRDASHALFSMALSRSQPSPEARVAKYMKMASPFLLVIHLLLRPEIQKASSHSLDYQSTQKNSYKIKQADDFDTQDHTLSALITLIIKTPKTSSACLPSSDKHSLTASCPANSHRAPS